jgi:hypothetical protein
LQHAAFNRSALIRLLSETHPQIPDPKYDFGERLGRWLDLSDAMTLFSVLGAGDGGRTSLRPSPCPAEHDLPNQLLRVRRTLSEAIDNDGVFSAASDDAQPRTPPRIPFPTLAPDNTADSAPDFTPFHRYYLAHQREMSAAITTLRADSRRTLAAHSAAGRQLAALDAAFEKSLSAREQNLMANIPILLAKRFNQRYAEHCAATDDTDLATSRTQPRNWLEAFCNDTKRVLLAELDLRLKPVAGLIAALSTTSGETNA